VGSKRRTISLARYSLKWKTVLFSSFALKRHQSTPGDGKTLALWQHFRDLSIEKYKETYKRLNVFFDVYSGESAVGKDAIDKVMERLKEKNLLTTKTKEESTRDYKAMRGKGKGKEATKTEPAHEEPAGAEPPEPVAPQEGASQSDASLAYAVDLAQYNLGKPVVQKGGEVRVSSRLWHMLKLRTDGTTIYIVRDLAEAIRRYEKYKFDKMIYVVGDQQDAHVAQFFKILELMGYEWAPTMQHVNFGKIFGMSTRNGEVKFLEEILDMSQEAMLNQMKTAEAKFKEVEDPDYTSDQIGMTCVKVQDMNSKRYAEMMIDSWLR
jgi:arginyl-tRNA synthetase